MFRVRSHNARLCDFLQWISSNTVITLFRGPYIVWEGKMGDIDDIYLEKEIQNIARKDNEIWIWLR